jgi:hypothetical protein
LLAYQKSFNLEGKLKLILGVCHDKPVACLTYFKKIEGEQKNKVLGLSDKTVACLPLLFKLPLHDLLYFNNFILFF